MLSSAGCSYDVLGYIYPPFGAPHDGMKFSTSDEDQDTTPGNNCAEFFGGGWWFTKCGVFILTDNNPSWFCPPDTSWYDDMSMRMMVKLQ